MHAEWWRKLRGWVRRDHIDAELAEEIRTHLDMKASDGGDLGAARRQFGNTTRVLEESRAAWGWPRMEGWFRDLRYGLRMMARRPGFAATIVLTLALGIGATSTIFSLIDTVLIRPLAYPDSGRLVRVNTLTPAPERLRSRVSPGQLEDWQHLATSFEALAGHYLDTFTETSGSTPERTEAATVSPRFFSVLRVAPTLGRMFSVEEERYGGPPAVLISDGLWRRRFGADPRALGRTLRLTDQSYTIVGVMPPSFKYPSASIDVWIPKQARPELMQIRPARFYITVGRLKPNATPEQAQADLAAIQETLGKQYPKTERGWSVTVSALKDEIVGNVRLALWLLLSSVGLLLLIACANVACLLLGQLNSRTAEIATRSALGASRTAIVRQLFAEGMAYTLAGGLLGMAATYGGIVVLRKRLSDLPRITELAVDTRVLSLVVAISFLTAILFSLAPILQTFRHNLIDSLTRGGRSVVGGGQRLTRILVSAQLALATVLLIGAGLFLQSLLRLQEAPLGFRTDNVLTLRVGATFSEAPNPAAQRHHRTMEALAALPGVRSVAMAFGPPGVDSYRPTEFRIAGEPDPNGVKQIAATRVVTAAYFETLGIPILSGATCRMTHDAQRPFAALVNRQFVDRFLPGRNPVGRTLIDDRPMEIVGVVGDVREKGFHQEPEPTIYICGFLRFWPDSDFLIQTAGDPAAMANSVREAIRKIEPSRAAYAVRPLTEVLDNTLVQNRFRTFLVVLFSAMALALAAIGLYGVMAYMVTQRTREIGIRVAMGARPAQVLSEILRAGGILIGVGAITGVILAAAVSRPIASLLYGVRSFDATTYLSAAVVLFTVALLACLIPGRRATSIDPARALREQ